MFNLRESRTETDETRYLTPVAISNLRGTKFDKEKSISKKEKTEKR